MKQIFRDGSLSLLSLLRYRKVFPLMPNRNELIGPYERNGNVKPLKNPLL